jgi:dTDP-4-dehydrorhamnose reductase
MPATSRIVVFGRGFLGTRMAREIPGATLAHGDITDRAAVIAALREGAADAAINAAGRAGRPNVDWCESHRIETYRSNVVGALTLADACAEAGVYLLHLGSGCVFDGASPSPEGWREDDHASPQSFYARTKYAADLVLSRLPNVAIARLRMPVDDAPGERNLITKLAGYPQVIDVENSMTIVADLVRVAARIVEARATGVFHIVNPGRMRHRDLLALYREIVDPSHSFTLIPNDELVARGLAVRARSNCVLASPRLAEIGVTLRPIDVAVHDAMKRYARALRGV